MILKLFKYFKEYRWRYFIYNSFVRCVEGGKVLIAKNVRIYSSQIYIGPNAQVIIKEGVLIKNLDLFLEKGTLFIDHNSIILGFNHKKMIITINNGSLTIGNHSRIQMKRIWIRFGGMVKIGNYTNINAESEIRADELVKIGDYNQISYHVNIWDTNTHNIYLPEKRAELTRKYFPYYGYEYEKPKTSPVVIANNCWIGERASLLKGTKIGDNVIVGYNTLLSNITIEDNKKVVQDIKIRIL